MIYSARVPMTRATLDLPVELWGKVFTYRFQSDPCSCQDLTCVNHRFNAIDCSTPQLWTRMSFTRERHFSDLELTRALLRRAGCLPSDVCTSPLSDSTSTRSYDPICGGFSVSGSFFAVGVRPRQCCVARVHSLSSTEEIGAVELSETAG